MASQNNGSVLRVGDLILQMGAIPGQAQRPEHLTPSAWHCADFCRGDQPRADDCRRRACPHDEAGQHALVVMAASASASSRLCGNCRLLSAFAYIYVVVLSLSWYNDRFVLSTNMASEKESVLSTAPES